MARYRQPPKDIVQFTSDLEKRTGKLERLPRAVSTSVDSGTFQVKSGDFDVANIAHFGTITLSDGQHRGWILYDQHGRARIYTGGDAVHGNQFINILDNSGNTIFSDDAASAVGLARPYIPWTIIPTSLMTGVGPTDMGASTNATSFTDFYDFHAYKQHPFIQIDYVYMTDAGSYQIMYFDNMNGSQIGSTITLPGGVGPVIQSDKIPLLGNHESFQEVVMRGKRVSGTGSLGVSVFMVHGVQT